MSQDKISRKFFRVESGHDLLAGLDRGVSAAEGNRWAFEVAWEVANKGNQSHF